MNKNYAIITILGLVLCAAAFGVAVEAVNRDNFWTEAAQSGMAEVMLGNLALQKSGNSEIKSFAEKMVADHTAANEELKKLAAQKGVTLPTDVNSKQKSAMNKLSNMSGMNFDKAFMMQMVKDHEMAVKLFRKEAENGMDADSKAFAAKTLPTLEGHLEMARSMNNGMKNMKNMDQNNNRNSNSMMNSNDRMDSGNQNNSSNMNRNPNMDMKSNMNMNRNSNMNSNMNMNSNGNSNRNRSSNTNSNSNSNSNKNKNSNSNMTNNSNDNRMF